MPGVGPSLYDVGLRLDEDALLQSIIDPDETMSDGFEMFTGLMSSSLKGNGFYKNVNKKELAALVQYLARKVGEN